jgi:hypothetical protein
MKYALLAFALTLSGPALAGSDIVRKCLMQVDGKTYINGPCRFARVSDSDDGSFGIESLTPKRPGKSWPWQVTVGPDGGYWNNDEGHPALHQHDNFGGPMRRQGACWVNARAKVCAWK